MNPRRPSLVRLAMAVALALIATAAPRVEASEESGGPLDHLGIAQFSCRCSQTRDPGSDAWLWLFVSEPEIGAVDPEGPSHGKLRAGDVLVAVDGWLITTRAGGERFSEIAPGVPVELTVRRGGVERRETIVPRAAEEYDDAPDLDRSVSSLTIKLAELSEALAELARVSPELDDLDLTELPELPDLQLPDQSELSLLGDFKIDTRPLGWFGIGLSFSGSMRQRPSSNELPLWEFNEPPKVHSLDRDGPAARAGLRRGDVLTHIDGVRLDSAEGGESFSEVRPGQTVVWTVRRGGRSLEVPITAEEPPE